MLEGRPRSKKHHRAVKYTAGMLAELQLRIKRRVPNAEVCIGGTAFEDLSQEDRDTIDRAAVGYVDR